MFDKDMTGFIGVGQLRYSQSVFFFSSFPSRSQVPYEQKPKKFPQLISSLSIFLSDCGTVSVGRISLLTLFFFFSSEHSLDQPGRENER